jgi:uncharacterized membrane protein YvbJ
MEHKFVECPNCGHNWTDTEKVCKYCGSANPNYKATSSISETLSNFSLTSNSSNSTCTNKNFSVILFVILMVFCWPIGIVYLLICLKK